MGFALHGLHVAILVAGALGVWAMLRPTVTSGRTVAALRRDAQRGTLAQAALRRALVTDRLAIARSTTAVRALHGYSVAGAAVIALVAAEWTIGVPVSGWALGAVALGMFVAGAFVLDRPRPAGQVLVAAALAGWAAHAVLVATASLGAGGGVSRVLSAVLWCHPVGVAPPRVTVLGYVVRPAAAGSVSVSLSGMLAVGAACLVTACVAGLCNRHVTRAAWVRAGA